MDTSMLDEIFRFSYKLPSASQNEATCKSLASHFRDFVESVKPAQVEGFAFSMRDGPTVPLYQVEERELDELKRACRVLTRDQDAKPERGEVWIEKWFPEYGCALQMEMVSVASLALKLVFVDAWKHAVHCLPGHEYAHSAAPTSYSVLNCTRILPSAKVKFMSVFEEELERIKHNAARNHNSGRNADTGSVEMKHHKTPQFIVSVMDKVVRELGAVPVECVVSRGGTTDVGLHSDSRQRDTCWPLVQGVLAQHLPGVGVLLDKAMLLFKLHLLEAKANALGESRGPKLASEAEDAFAMLQNIALQTVGLVQQGYDAAAIEGMCAALRDTLLSCIRDDTERNAERCSLPGTERLEEIVKSMNYPAIGELTYVDELKNADVSVPDSAYIREQLEFLEFVDPRACSPAGLIAWLTHLKTVARTDANVTILAMRTAEAFVFAKAALLQDNSMASIASDEVRNILCLYESFAAMWLTNKVASGAIFDVEQRSHELLVKWIAFCFVHQNVCRSHRLVCDYGIALDWTHLHAAVLRDEAAISALSETASYIRSWNQWRSAKPLFDLNNQAPTMQFARAFALSHPLYPSRHALVMSELEAQITTKWGEVRRKKARAATLRSQISSLNSTLLQQQQTLNSYVQMASSAKLTEPESRRVCVAQSAVDSTSHQIKQEESELVITLVVPPFITSPLPEDRMRALEVLFLMEMPHEIELLGELCFIAQRALGAPDSGNLRDYVPYPSWREHFNNHNSGMSYSSSVIVAFPMYLSVPGAHGPTSVDHLETRDDFARKCVWYPSGESTKVFWQLFVNPFMITQQMMIEWFTHQLPRAFQDFQWAIAYPGGESRGNRVYAKGSDQFLDGFDKPAFAVFGLLRAFPNQQVRKVCCAVKDNVLPWSHPCVGAVIRQALFQIGELTDSSKPVSQWKTDIQRSQGLAIFCAAVDRAATQLSCSPRNFEDVPILSELAAFVSQWTSDAQCVVSKFAAMCRRWAEGVKKQYLNNQTLSTAEKTELRAHECLLYGYALQSYTLGDCDDSALFAIGESIVLFRNSMFFSAGSERWDALKKLEIAIAETMARRISDVVQYVASASAATDQKLTSILKLVNSSAPAGLQWSLLAPEAAGEHGSSCFEAYDSLNQTHFSINLLNGVVLTDGNTSGGLPVQIRANEQYRELFGDQDFEVTFSKGVYKTAHSIGECYFHFALVKNKFHLREVYLEGDGKITKTLVLCESSWIKAILKQKALPRRVLAMHSLWFWVEEHCVLARPKSAFEKDVAFVLTIKDDCGHARAKCFEIPVADQRKSHEVLVESLLEYDSVVHIDNELVKIVERFEDEAYIHALRTPEGRLKLSFPRYRLTFVQDAATFELRSLEFGGYVLDRVQQFEDAFPNFRRYLVLKLIDETALAKPVTRILMPLGLMVEHRDGTLDVALSRKPDAKLDFVVFDEHRRLQTLSTESITARLQLCAVLTSTGSSITSQRLKMTGTQAALQALRGCHSSHPHSDLNLQLLKNICAFGYREPALRVLASCILEKASKCSFLVDAPSLVLDCANAQDAYSAMCVQTPERNPLRCRLSKPEEKLFVGQMLHCEGFKETPSLGTLNSLPSPVKSGFVNDVESQLASFLVHESRDDAAITPLPVKPLKNTRMGKAMNAELEQSWRAYHKHPDARLSDSLQSLLARFQQLGKRVARARTQVLSYLLKCVDATRSDICSRLLAMVDYLPVPTMTDIIRSSHNECVLTALIPRASPSARLAFKTAVLQCMELCVLEDKLERLAVSAQQGAPPTYFVDELSSRRHWGSREFPYWLAFEVEGRLQIRHEQYVVAKHLIENRGAVCQMNVGRGKTRVILPMLFLYFSHRHRGDRLVRAHFLTALLSETRQFMHQYLSASSVLELNFVELPFHRNIALDEARLSQMLEAIDEAKLCGKFLIVAPECRMSLELKQLDLRARASGSAHDELAEMLDEILDEEHYIDVLDECDAVLHHRYHLVYAVGAPLKLENGSSRWAAVEALLSAMVRSEFSEINAILQRPGVSFRCAEYAARLGGYSGLRLNASIDGKAQVRSEMRHALAVDLLNDPPGALRSMMSVYRGTEFQDRLTRAMVDPNVSLDEALGDMKLMAGPDRDQLLTLRGLLAFGVLEHCLEKRHRVEYGLPDPGTRTKRTAIPFRAADIPSERSEFSHPEVGIALTVLAFYHAGLSKDALKESLQQLLLLSISEQAHEYSKWFEAVEEAITPEEIGEMPREADQLSPMDTRQFALLFKVYRYSMEAINFFLNTCVFPNDTTQFSRKLSRSAWNLAGGDWNIGFSGTNDNHRLLPLSVRQHEPDQPSLLGTNGRMLDRIAQVTHGYEVVRPDQVASVTPWKALLRLAMEKQAHALIDTGALLAGVLNNDAAMHLLELPGFDRFAGVTYYDTRKNFDCWVILDATNKHATPLKKATILEKDTFVIFDDARSRGSDMKLYPSAVAMLTLGPKLAKDKMMQGAGRMRQLGCDQTLWLVSLDEVAQSILQVCDKADVASVCTVDILDWVMENTQLEATFGLLEWASSGLHFAKTRGNPDAELTEEDWSLESLYASAYRPQQISAVVRSKVQAVVGGNEDELDKLVKDICERGITYGCDDEVLVATHNEECERELHIEVFEDRVDEVERLRVTPVPEVAWAFETLLQCSSVHSLYTVAGVMRLGEFVRTQVKPTSLGEVNWDSTQVFGTANFFATIAAAALHPLSQFIRLVDVVLLFADGTKLLLSEYEADQVLSLLWGNKTADVGFQFVNLAYAVDSIEKHGANTKAKDVPWGLGRKLELQLQPALVALCQLYNGETAFTKDWKELYKTALCELLARVRDREPIVREFVVARGNTLRWPRSFLYDICSDMDLETSMRLGGSAAALSA